MNTTLQPVNGSKQIALICNMAANRSPPRAACLNANCIAWPARDNQLRNSESESESESEDGYDDDALRMSHGLSLFLSVMCMTGARLNKFYSLQTFKKCISSRHPSAAG